MSDQARRAFVDFLEAECSALSVVRLGELSRKQPASVAIAVALVGRAA